ncbi:hypothetical protein GCM10010384_29430 [Streptomyces djakartensis]|uniref:Uncharacterized protein n=1 Tax=Streptomyces djakartensis TaxID=68193 RepID=A0ABQ2ZN39_9ACTN|nr:hypothetical protein GCM10010384_29430 [Streptomyces djakartensis]
MCGVRTAISGPDPAGADDLVVPEFPPVRRRSLCRCNSAGRTRCSRAPHVSAPLHNASTVVTVGIGVLVCCAGLLVINLVWALFTLNGQVYASMARRGDPGSRVFQA